MPIGGTGANSDYFLYGGQNFSDVPLPADLTITPADDGVSSDHANFLGIWGGVSSEGDLNHILIVEKIEAGGAKIIYALGKYPVWGDGLYRRLAGVFVEDGLKVIEPTELGGYTVIYKLNANDTLSLSATHPTLPDGETVMTRQPSMPRASTKAEPWARSSVIVVVTWRPELQPADFAPKRQDVLGTHPSSVLARMQITRLLQFPLPAIQPSIGRILIA